MPLKKPAVLPTLYTTSKHIQPFKNAVFLQFPVEHQTYVRKCDGAKSLRALLAALKVKTKKVHLLYFENHILFFFNYLFNTV